MKILMIITLLTAGLVAQEAGNLSAEDSTLAEFDSLMSTIDFPATRDNSGRYELILDFEDGRSQLCYVNLATSDLDSSTVLEVWAPMHRSTEPVEGEISRNLLMANALVIGGSFQIYREESGYLALFSAQIPFYSESDEVDQAILWVASIADEMEKSLINRDDM